MSSCRSFRDCEELLRQLSSHHSCENQPQPQHSSTRSGIPCQYTAASGGRKQGGADEAIAALQRGDVSWGGGGDEAFRDCDHAS